MTLQERLSQEIKSAMLAKDADKLSTLRLLKSALGYVQIERKTENLLIALMDEFQALATKSEDGISDHNVIDRLRLYGLRDGSRTYRAKL